MSIGKTLKSKWANLQLRIARTSPKRYVKYLRRQGCKIGNDLWITPHLDTLRIDVTRPSLIEIGDHVRLNLNVTILTHDFSSYVFRHKYHEFVASSGRVKIGNNVYLGRNVTILKGVEIGDNCIIGFGSTVTRSIPANSVAVGSPAKVICTLDQYFEKRKQASMEEAFAYARSIQERYGRRPVPADFWEEFGLFVSGDQIADYPTIPIKQKLKEAYPVWVKEHKAPFANFDEFLKAAGL